ncbi:MAG: helix-turn-helix transcriptional regulator [Acidimicrobiia bacterium]|nr:helix-turn-helix transcriptional regulator [Acidimicrobiia bacterium]
MASPSVSQVMAVRIRRYRKALDWTQERLSEETGKFGPPMSRSTIAKIEGGQTRGENISLVDTFVLAAALNVPPPLLFLPLGEEDRVAVTPALRLHPHLVLDWITGDLPLVGENRKALGNQGWGSNARPIWLFRELRAHQTVRDEARAAVAAADKEDDVGWQQEARRRLDEALLELDWHRETMERAGLRVPAGLFKKDETNRLVRLRTERG